VTDQSGSTPPHLREIARRLQATEEPEDSLEPEVRQLEAADRRQDIELKKDYASWLKWLLTGQMIVANVVVVAYAHFGVDWQIPAPVISSWLAATVIEVLGVVYVVTRYLFPNRDSDR
jgi:hypothetical protein